MMTEKSKCRHIFQLKIDDVLYVITNRPIWIPKANITITVTEGAPWMVEKPTSECKTEYKMEVNLDNIIKNILYKILDKNMYSKIKTCSRAK